MQKWEYCQLTSVTFQNSGDGFLKGNHIFITKNSKREDIPLPKNYPNLLVPKDYPDLDSVVFLMLNQLGSEGWEVIDINGKTYFLKRPLP